MKPHWNYRIIKSDGAETTFSIREVFYDEKGEVTAISEADSGPFGQSVTELINDWHKIGKALTLPVLTMPGVDEAEA